MSEIAVDGEEYSLCHCKNSWALAALVACHVEPGSGTGVGSDQESTKWFGRTTFRRVSAREFARRTGTSPKRIMALYDAWNRAAADGVVPSAACMTPGLRIELPDEIATPFHGANGYYHSYQAPMIKPETKRVEIKMTAPVCVAANPAAVKTDVAADAAAPTATAKNIPEYEQGGTR